MPIWTLTMILNNMTFEAFSEMLLVSKTHYDVWLTGWYLHRNEVLKTQRQQALQSQNKNSRSVLKETSTDNSSDGYDDYEVA